MNERTTEIGADGFTIELPAARTSFTRPLPAGRSPTMEAAFVASLMMIIIVVG